MSPVPLPDIFDFLAHHEHEHHAHEEAEELPARNSRQGAAAEGDGLPEQENAIDIGAIAEAGERCVEKVGQGLAEQMKGSYMIPYCHSSSIFY